MDYSVFLTNGSYLNISTESYKDMCEQVRTKSLPCLFVLGESGIVKSDIIDFVVKLMEEVKDESQV